MLRPEVSSRPPGIDVEFILKAKVTALTRNRIYRPGAKVLVLQKDILTRGNLGLQFKVSNILIFNDDRLCRFRPGLSCISVRKKLTLFHDPSLQVYII